MRKLLLVLGVLAAVPVVGFGAAQRNAVRMGSDLTIPQGTTVYDAVAIGGNLVVNGSVQHDAVAIGGTVTLNEGAAVGHNAVAVGGRIIGNTALVAGDTVEAGVGPHSFPRDIRAFFALLGFLSLLGFLVLTLLVAAVFPQQVSTVSRVVETEAAPAVLWGIVGILLIVPVALLLAVTVIGIMLIPLELMLVFAAFLFGYIAVSAFIGRRVLTALKRGAWPQVGETLLGAVLLMLAGWIPLIGWLVTLAVLLVGFGAVLHALFGRRRPSPSGPTPVVM